MEQKHISVVGEIEANVIRPLYSALMSFNADLPLPEVVEHWFGKIKQKKNFNYCISLLGKIKAIVDNPSIVIDSLAPVDFSTAMKDEELDHFLESAFCMPKELLDSFPETFSVQALHFCKEATTVESRQRLDAYKGYFRTLYQRLSPMAPNFGLYFDESFSISERLFVRHSPKVLVAVYEFLVKEGCLYGDTNTRDAFLALFSNMGMIPQGYRIKWKKTTSTMDNTNMHLLYITLTVLGVDLTNKHLRNIAESMFIGRDEEPISLKKRESRRSDAFKQRLQAVINANS